MHALSVEKMVTGQRNVLAKVHTHAVELRLNRLYLIAYVRGSTQHHVTITETILVGMCLERVAIMIPLRRLQGITDACQVPQRTSVITPCHLRGPRVITTNTGLGAHRPRVTTDPDTSGTQSRREIRRHHLGITIGMIEDLWMIGMSHRLAVGQGRRLAPLQVAGITTKGLRVVMNNRNVWNVVARQPRLVLSMNPAAAAWRLPDIVVALLVPGPRGMNLLATLTRATTLETGMRATGTPHRYGMVEGPGTTIVTAETPKTVTGHSESTDFSNSPASVLFLAIASTINSVLVFLLR